MQLTPSGAFEHVKESIVEYLETAYKIAHPAVFAERGEMLRRRGTVAQAPFIEATPAFPTARKLIELERVFPEFLPAGLAELVQHGVPVDRFALYTHQEEALLAAFSEAPDLLVATGTGSGKTEAFLLPILADVLREALTWPATDEAPQRGRYDARTNVWLHGRRHELRPAALRAIILYPMNALVNDQLARLRRILARDTSPDWQRGNLRGNVLHFGMYTSQTRPTGNWSSHSRRDRYDIYLKKIEEDWKKLRGDLRDTGGWPRPDSPEMLCRWDMQMAPPDILVTNYSMLEYMLVRPIESPIFERTRRWLHETPEARLTLVLDEAHTYTGAKGTEVAHLVRRLKERLGLDAGSPKFRAIATTASLPNANNAQQELRAFAADLFGEPPERFSLIRAAPPPALMPRQPSPVALDAFARFQETFDIQSPAAAVERLAQDLALGPVDPTVDPQVALYSLLETNDDVTWIRQRTARNATLIDQLAQECWSTVGLAEEQERATAGVLAAGSFARPSDSTDVPPLLSVRVHAFFRGIAGIWACMDPNCPEVPEHLRIGDSPRLVGKLYTDPRPWCGPACGARVLELFSCRHCGLLFLGGIPDTIHGSLWPWSDDLSGEREDLGQFRIFGVEPAHAAAQCTHRSTRSTLATHPNEAYARAVYEVEFADDGDGSASPFPGKCPRCQNYRAQAATARQIVEPLRTRGPRSFSIIVEDGFRVQPKASHGDAPNYGRKALLFTDSRQEAATLAADLREDHSKDLIRQLLFRALWTCQTCTGSGTVEQQSPFRIGQPQVTSTSCCPDCQGTGRAAAAMPLSFDALRGRVIGTELGAGINPTNGVVRDFFARLDAGTPSCYADAELAFAIALRRELAEDEFALEPLGLASWRVQLPESFGTFAPLAEAETHLLVRSIARLLATENVLLPARPQQPWDWPHDLVKEYERCVLIPAGSRQGKTVIPYNLGVYRKLGRYVNAVSQALVRHGRLASTAIAEQWVRDLHWPLWNALRQLGVLEPAGAKINGQVPHGIRIDAFDLHPVGDSVQRCRACAYIMSEALLAICLRCGQRTEQVPTQTLRNFYRRAALHALPGSGFDDPYPLRAIEHSAQIPGAEARDIERWFQDLFHDHQQPLDHRVDVLSVTTTMEMGIDIGSLLCVGLRNVPPTVANYQQRAGRAGRRGSAIATVLTFAQARSHDQYYFQRPPEIVSTPPRVPALYLNNDVIARRHVRSLVLQGFFAGLLQGRRPSDLFSSWGTVADFADHQSAAKLRHYLATYFAPLIARCTTIVDPAFADDLGAWLQSLVDEVQEVVNRYDARDDLFSALITAGLLPKYAFPVDVVSLTIPSTRPSYGADDESADSDAMQRDLRIAIAEYAPGAEVMRGSFPNTYLYRSAGLYDPYQSAPDYRPTGTLLECQDCQSVALLAIGVAPPDQCPECQSLNVNPLPYLRPAGFTVDAAQPQGGGVRYEGGGRERGGYAGPARLLVGQTAFNTGRPQAPFAPRLYAYVRRGDLFVCNKGSNRDFPGFLICATCGRALDEREPGPHTYPANIPPHRGRQMGPRAGQPCPNRTDFQNQVILGHSFASEVILLGVDLPATMDAPFGEPSGKAVWYSFGTLVANAAALILQVDPGELKVGVRAVRQSPSRVLGEVFLYDDVPGGAGYARAIEQHLQAILEKAQELARACRNPECSGACYHCMYDYRNQRLHPLLDRHLGSAVLDYLLCGMHPNLDPQRTEHAAAALGEFGRFEWTIKPAITIGGHRFACVLEDASGQQTGLWVIHPLEARPGPAERMAILAQYGVRPAVHTVFDLERRPFWVLNNLTRP